MPDLFMALHIIVSLAGSMGYTAIRYTEWLARNDRPQPNLSMAPLLANVNMTVSTFPLRRRSLSPRGSPKRKSQGELGVHGGVTKVSQKLRLERIPCHRFSRPEILDMVKVRPSAPVVCMSMMARQVASDVPSPEVSFASPEDCDRVYAEVKRPLERDGILVSQVGTV
ncbi:hypothetical protein FGB62_62g017 [Gracilaria domingensis]|nr:hypothetical protein FGB62_62g017 [Gracilaria domingensis]